ncbi:hypothetical protein TanjilG_00953 [Lupinus angustifolius]|uniref:Uncharacterized protein n=1 Tax=Lupinus angustifolius TaxID=3871 RepID=A0A4P1QQY9_LUPAN|nr:PREDICTED: uncharacterized protein LOC109332679 [Lupinus angustifolius]OIV92819.1 hypothetical protein TanjilG_00953 [Lupinus angustifolius]
MDCLVMPISLIHRRSTGSRFGYIPLNDDALDQESNHPMKVIVGKEKKVFLVDPFILQEYPFQLLMNISMKKEPEKKDRFHFTRSHSQKRVIFVDVDVLLFEHMLWLMHNDASSLSQLNLKDIIDFYAQDM